MNLDQVLSPHKAYPYYVLAFAILMSFNAACAYKSLDSLWDGSLYPIAPDDPHLKVAGEERARKDLAVCRNLHRKTLEAEYGEDFVWYVEKRLATKAKSVQPGVATNDARKYSSIAGPPLSDTGQVIGLFSKGTHTAAQASMLGRTAEGLTSVAKFWANIPYVGVAGVLFGLAGSGLAKLGEVPLEERPPSKTQLQIEDEYEKFLAKCLRVDRYSVNDPQRTDIP